MKPKQSGSSAEDFRAIVQEQRERIEALEASQRKRSGMRLPGRMVLLLTAASLIAVGALTGSALAGTPVRIPDANGVIHGCYSTKTGNLRVIGGSCRQGEKSLNWSQRAATKFCPRCSFASADLHGQDLTGAYFPLTSLYSVNLSHAQLGSSYLVNAEFQRGGNIKVNGTPQPAPVSNLDHANFSNADLRSADLAEANAPSSAFAGADMHYGYLDGANFFQANFYAADLSFAFARGTYFRGANLEFANIQDMMLSRAIFSDADLRLAHGKPYDTGNTVFSNTTCPDGTNSNTNAGNTCDGHWLP